MAGINLPKGRDLASEYSKTLSAQIGILPSMLAAQAQYAPVQAANQLSNLNSLLLGTPDMGYATQAYSPAIYQNGGKFKYGKPPAGFAGTIDYTPFPQVGKKSGAPGISTGTWTVPRQNSPEGGFLGATGSTAGDGALMGAVAGPLGAAAGASIGSFVDTGNPDPLSSALGINLWGDDDPWKRISKGGYETKWNQVGAQQGLLSLYQNYLAPTLEATQEASNSSQRASDIADVGNLGPAAMAAIMNSDPRTAALLEKLTSQASSELGMGAQLDPSLMRLATQSVRGRRQGMLGGTGNAGDFGEAMGLTQFGQQLQQQRRANAGGVIGLRQQVYGDPFSRVLGRQSAGLGASSNTLNQALGLGGQSGPMSLLNPESSYAQDINNGNWNALVNQAIGNANNTNALIGAGISSIGSLAGGAMGAI